MIHQRLAGDVIQATASCTLVSLGASSKPVSLLIPVGVKNPVENIKFSLPMLDCVYDGLGGGECTLGSYVVERHKF